MIVLAIDTAGVDCSAALFDSETGATLAAVTEMIGKGHAERLMAVIDEALVQGGRDLNDVERIVVITGPGSFTGIRVGVAAARGLALALDIPCIGVTTLEVLAAKHRETGATGPVSVVMDAKRGEVYVQAFSADGAPLSVPAAMAPSDVATLTASLSADVIGSGRHLVFNQPSDPSGVDRFDISTVARIGATKPVEAARPRPVYLRGPDAKPQLGYALARV